MKVLDGELKLEREKRELMFDKRVQIGEISCGGSLLAAQTMFFILGCLKVTCKTFDIHLFD